MKKISLLVVLCGLLFPAALSYSQASQFGTIQNVIYDERLIVIDDTLYLFKIDDLKVSYKEEYVSTVHLREGIRVRHDGNEDFIISEIVLLGPEDELDSIKSQ